MALTGDKTTKERPLVKLRDVEAAHVRIKAFVHRTPLLTSATLDALATQAINNTGSRVRVQLAFKGEHLQRVGAFKMRGATNAVRSHLEQLKSSSALFDPGNLWVVTHSSGNHAAAVACAARSVGANAGVVMPNNAPQVKKAAVRGYGARIVECEPTQAAREATADCLMVELQRADSANVVKFIHPYDEEMVIAGQGTLALEMLQQALQSEATCNVPTLQPNAQALQSTVQTLESNVKTLLSVEESMQSTTQTLRANAQTLQPKSRTLQPIVCVLEFTVKKLESTVQSVQSNAQTLQSVAETLQATTLQSGSETLGSTVKSLQFHAQTLHSNTRTLQATVLKIWSTTIKLDSAVGLLDSHTETLRTVTQMMTATVEALELLVDSVQHNAQTLQSNAEMLESNAETLRAQTRSPEPATPKPYTVPKVGQPWVERDTQLEPVFDLVVAPVGGGGMLSGVSTAMKGKDPRISVIGAEPENADDAARSFASGVLQPAVSPPRTICDGLLTALSPFTLAHVQAHVTDILTASEREIVTSTQLVWERMKQVIEPSAAVGLAVVLNNPRFAEYVHRVAKEKRQVLAVPEDKEVEIRIGVVWTGGNVELAAIADAIAKNQ